MKELTQQVIRILEGIQLKGRTPEGLYAPMQYTLELGGKRLRPLMALLAYRMYQEEGSTELIAPVIRAVELFHNFSLIHDDVMDNAPLRRGKSTVHQKWGNNTAILSGDGMLIEAYHQLALLPPQQLAKVLPIFNRVATGVCEGQQLDMEFETRLLAEVALDDYLLMIRLKTAYLFEGAVQMGALVANAPEPDLHHLRKAAELSGLAFQIMDDYLDTFPEPHFGKQRGGDILERKKTWLLITAYQKEPTELEQALATPDEDERIANVTRIYQDTMTDERALQEAQLLTREALKHLQQISVAHSKYALVLRQLLERLVGRDR